MFKIGDFSKISGVTPRMLKYYEEVELLMPSVIDESNGYRYYDEDQLAVIAKIKMLQSIGFSSKEMKSMINDEIPLEMFSDKKKEISDNIKQEEELIRSIEFFENAFTNLPFTQYYTVVIRSLPSQTVITKRDVFHSISDIEKATFAMMREGEAKKYKFTEPIYGIVEYNDAEYREEDMDCMITLPIDREGKPSSMFNTEVEKAYDKVACILHKGSYKFLPYAYIFAYDWIATNGFRAVAPAREKYIAGFWNKPDNTSDYITELEIPVEKIK